MKGDEVVRHGNRATSSSRYFSTSSFEIILLSVDEGVWLISGKDWFNLNETSALKLKTVLAAIKPNGNPPLDFTLQSSFAW